MSQMTLDMFHNQVLSPFMTYHWVCNISNTTGATFRAGTAYPPGAHEFAHVVLLVLMGFVLLMLSNFMSS